MVQKSSDSTLLNRKILLASLAAILTIASVFTLLLIVKSSADFSRSGPAIRKEVLDHFKLYTVYAVARLGVWSFILTALSSLVGLILYWCFLAVSHYRFRFLVSLAAGASGFCTVSVLLFCRHLLFVPSSIAETSLYRISRFYPLWDLLTPGRIAAVQIGLLLIFLIALLAALFKLLEKKDYRSLFIINGTAVLLATLVTWATWMPEDTFIPQNRAKSRRPNIVLLGADTMRADRLGVAGYRRDLTPCIDSLARSGIYFKNCYVPMARTAPSLASILTGTWPHTHGIRDNYIGDSKLRLGVETLPQILHQAGYRTGVITDWAGSDLKKLSFGFEFVDAPDDQWNLKFLIRQGPKDLKLFLTLFTHNRFGKTFLPELYYLAGIPLTSDLGYYTRQKLREWSKDDKPFFLMVFASSTHVPFGTEYPYYSLYADRNYRGESKFSMAGLTTPEEVVAKQAKGQEAFDVSQIMNIYDGAVRSFDDEVAKITHYLQEAGLYNNTIVVIYSDHGIDLFERNSWGQGNQVAGVDYSARIPLVLSVPGYAGGKIVNKVVRSVDIAPTLLGLAGLPSLQAAEGVSLVPYLDNASRGIDLQAYVETGLWLNKIPGFKDNHLTYPTIIELLEVKNKTTGTLSVKPNLENVAIMAKDRMVQDGDWKMIYLPMKFGAVFSLYNLRNDPQCNFDVAALYPKQYNAMKDHLIDWMCGDKKRKWDGNYLIPN